MEITMQKIKKTAAHLPQKYADWLALVDKGTDTNKDFRTHYDDIVMNLYQCQQGVCAYTEAFICPAELYGENNWANGKYKIANDAAFTRVDHRGELEHFDASKKKAQYWNWDNLFMIEARINSIKTNKPVAIYLKPDVADYSPEKYFDYDEETHRFIPNTAIDDDAMVAEIRKMIDEVLCLNHGVVLKDRENYIKELKDKKQRGQDYTVDRFFTAVKWVV